MSISSKYAARALCIKQCSSALVVQPDGSCMLEFPPEVILEFNEGLGNVFAHSYLRINQRITAQHETLASLAQLFSIQLASSFRLRTGALEPYCYSVPSSFSSSKSTVLCGHEKHLRKSNAALSRSPSKGLKKNEERHRTRA